MKISEGKVLPRYSLSSNIIFLIKKSWQLDKTVLFATIARIPVIVALPLLATYLSKYVVALVSNGSPAGTLIACVVCISVAILLLRLLDNFVSTKIEWRSVGNRFFYINLLTRKIMDTDYENVENPDGQVKMQKALNTLGSTSGGTQMLFTQLVNVFSNITGLVTYSVLITAFSPWIVVLLFVMTAANYYVNKLNNSWVHGSKDKWVPIDRKLNYIRNKAGEFEAAKDVRLYGISGWFKNIFEELLADRMAWSKKTERRGFTVDFLSAIMSFARDGAAYAFLIFRITGHAMSPADFVLYFGLISQYSGWLFGLIDSYNSLQTTSLGFCDVRGFLDLPDRFNRGKGAALPQDPPEIRFDNVSFRYPKAENDALKELSFTIKQGERIAIVGQNGAGKTTLVKLLCGLYLPCGGSITVGNEDMANYNRDEYYMLLSVVFQDIHLMPVSIAKNIALCEEPKIDRECLTRALKLSGLYEKVQKLPEKENTLLLKSIYDCATDLSGGEKQKLALARALYKEGRIIILDEPTAALDPIAENEIYMKYSELTTGATSVYISHRLSSTRFCDRILFLENGELVEEGTHNELMACEGKYAAMFNLQSHYYKEEAVGDEAI